MKVYVFDYGTIMMPRLLILNETGTFDLEDEEARAKDLLEIPVSGYLVDHPDGKILFDAGNAIFVEDLTPEVAGKNPITCLKELDIDPSEIKYVVVSHTHMDHTAYLQYFKNAEIIIHEDEFNMIQGIRESGEYGLAYFKPVVDTWFDADLKWKLVSGTHELEEILPGVQLLKCGIGHSNGMLGLMVELEESGTIIMTSDAVYVPENFGPPISTPGLCHNREDYIKTVEWIAKLRDANNATIWYGHNMDQFKQLTLSTEGYYE